MIPLTVLLVFGQGLPGASTPVDFRLLGPPQHAVRAVEHSLPPPAENKSTSSAPTRSVAKGPSARPGAEIARGFGTEIPLGFAARQIVPARLQVIYGAGVRPDDRVSWIGGNPWNRVLQDAIKPLGLRMTATGTVVSITR